MDEQKGWNYLLAGCVALIVYIALSFALGYAENVNAWWALFAFILGVGFKLVFDWVDKDK